MAPEYRQEVRQRRDAAPVPDEGTDIGSGARMRPAPLSESIRLFGRLAWWYPVAVLLGLYCTWLAAALALGRMPIPSVDDPKDVHATVAALRVGVMAAMEIGPQVFFVGLIGVCWLCFHRRLGWAKSLTSSSLFVALWARSAWLLFIDPGRVLDWLCD